MLSTKDAQILACGHEPALDHLATAATIQAIFVFSPFGLSCHHCNDHVLPLNWTKDASVII